MEAKRTVEYPTEGMAAGVAIRHLELDRPNSILHAFPFMFMVCKLHYLGAYGPTVIR